MPSLWHFYHRPLLRVNPTAIVKEAGGGSAANNLAVYCCQGNYTIGGISFTRSAAHSFQYFMGDHLELLYVYSAKVLAGWLN